MKQIMSRLILVPLVFLLIQKLNAQKSVIDTAIIRTWPAIGEPKISDNGAYVSYNIHNQPIKDHTLIVRSTRSDWHTEIKGAKEASFDKGSEFILFKINNEDLCILKLGTSETRRILNILDYKLAEGSRYLAYRSKTAPRELIILNLADNSTWKYDSVKQYCFSPGNHLLYQTASKDRQCLFVSSLPNKVGSLVWAKDLNPNSEININAFAFDLKQNQIAFVEEYKLNGATSRSIYLYDGNIGKMQLRVNDSTMKRRFDMEISIGELRFSADGTKLFFNLRQRNNTSTSSKGLNIDIWSYTDRKLQSQQLVEKSKRKSSNRVAVDNIEDSLIVILTEDDEEVIFKSMRDDYFLVRRRSGDINEWNWNLQSCPSIYLVSTKDGERKLLRRNIKEQSPYYEVSPDSKYVLYYDANQKNYFVYDIQREQEKNITKDIDAVWSSLSENDNPITSNGAMGIAGWLECENAVFIYDQYDIWKVDLAYGKNSINVTKGYGRANNISFRFLDDERGSICNPERKKNDITLVAFNRKDKRNGFYKLKIGSRISIELLTMESSLFHWPGVSLFPPIKAKNSEEYLFNKSNSKESNLYCTRDFKSFRPISSFNPQEQYNWLSTELISWPGLDGKLLSGILYKPENFDSTKKYPVIFNFYEKVSQNLHVYHKPESSGGDINIPYFVSNGYVVFTPDIYYRLGHTGEGAVNSIVSAAKYLSKYSWVDSKKMALQGHSFGGYEVNYLITKTNMFSAACSASGLSDFVSFYGSVMNNGLTAQYLCETDQLRIGSSLWENGAAYIRNSPIFSANKVSTPLLMLSNKQDGFGLFSQGVEFFNALRRLGKKTWMLQYDGEGHQVGGNAAIDYTIRLKQFFDHYLKDSAAPKWMLNGIPAKDKGVDDGLDLIREKDKSGKWLTPSEGDLLIPEERKKVDALQRRQPITITLN